MAGNYSLKIKLAGNTNPCHIGHQPGDEWLWEEKTPAGICVFAYNSIYPFALVLQSGGNFPWQENPDVLTVSCPDHGVVNRFELRRIPETGKKAESYDVSLKLINKLNDGNCSAGHKIGDEWILGEETPENICPSAYHNIYTWAMVLRYGGQFSWQSDPDVIMAKCPDWSVENYFEIRRIPRQ
jgi:uncharacterized repeat protein (TIGR04076 family)